uniref:Uncharacterized protein n=1 Tax=Cucumis melo TaxID=3656 RepID=A0A9I9EIC4_CUCME
MGSETFVEIILAILLPPLGVFLRYGCGQEETIKIKEKTKVVSSCSSQSISYGSIAYQIPGKQLQLQHLIDD